MKNPLEIYQPHPDFEVRVFKGGNRKGRRKHLDIRVKFRVWNGDSWSDDRSPAHSHLAADLMLKRQGKKLLTKKLLDHIIRIWNDTTDLSSIEDRNSYFKSCKYFDKRIIQTYSSLDNYGDFPVSVLLLIVRLIVVQEKTSHSNAHMFHDLVIALRSDKGVWDVISKARYS